MQVVDELAAELRRLYESRQLHAFIAAAHRALAQTADAPGLALLTLRALVELGLGGPALELVQLRRELAVNHTSRDALRASLASLPNGRTAWAGCESTFQANLAALATGRPEWRDKAAWLRGLIARLQLHRDRDGCCLLSQREPGRLREWLGVLGPPAEDVIARLPAAGPRSATLVIGARVGPLLETLHAQTRYREQGYKPPLYLLEPDPVWFAAWLHCADHSGWLGDERVYVFVGPDAAAQCEALWRAKPTLPCPTRLVDLTCEQSTADQLKRVWQRLESEEKTELAQLSATLAERYGARDARYWLQRVRPPGPILAVTSRFTTMLQYATRDALAALRRQGYATEVLVEPSDQEQMRSADLCRKILALDPIAVLALDHSRREISFVPRHLPILTWIQDALPELLCREAAAALGPYDFVCGYYRQRCVEEFGYQAERFLSVRIPVSSELFHDGPVDAEAARRYAADLCYVGHSGQPLPEIFADYARRYPAALHPRLAAVYRRVQDVLAGNEPIDPEMSTDAVVARIARDGEFSAPDLAYRLYDAGRRHQTLAWAAAWAQRTGRVLRIYGRGWNRHPTLAPYAQGVIEHGRPLRQAYRAAKLALQLLPSGFLHQRSLEALASGTLPLTRYCPEDFAKVPDDATDPPRLHPQATASLFPALGRVTFRTAAEFEERAEHYLADAADREAVVAELRGVVMRDYTYDVVMRNIMSAFRAALEQQAAESEAAPQTGHR